MSRATHRRASTDVFIAGGGIAGLTAALVLARAGLSVVLASPTPPRTGQNGDLRSTAILEPGRALLYRVGLWQALGTDAVPLRALRIVDCIGDPPTPRDTRTFQPDDVGLENFGWNVLNGQLTGALLQALEQAPAVDLRFGAGFADMTHRSRETIVRLTSGERIAARLVLGADGRESRVRQAAGIGADLRRSGQKALALIVTHPEPHGFVGSEVYHKGGPFTLVPLADIAPGQPASAVVWMNPAAEAQRLAETPPEALSEIMSQRSAHVLGPLTLASPVQPWPIVSLRAHSLTAERTALIAEAAHVMPPIGAQGLNTSLNDIAALVAAVENTGVANGEADRAAIGGPDMLAAYDRARARDVGARVAAIDLFNRVTRSSDPAVQSLRLAGLRAAHDIAPLRRGLMRAGIGG